MKKTILSIAVWALAASSIAAPYVILPDDQKREGTAIRANSKGDVILTTVQGDFTYNKGQYKSAHADPPPELQQVPALLQAKKFDEAIKILNDVAGKMRFLGWDVAARARIARIQGDLMGKAKEAIETFESLFSDMPEARNDPETMWAYLGLLAKGDEAAKKKLALSLDQLVKSPNRAAAAKAQNLRGDLKLAAGDVRGAARDYLRTVILFQGEEEALPEALFKAGEALEKMSDARAKKMYATLLERFPESDFAAKAKGKSKG